MNSTGNSAQWPSVSKFREQGGAADRQQGRGARGDRPMIKRISRLLGALKAWIAVPEPSPAAPEAVPHKTEWVFEARESLGDKRALISPGTGPETWWREARVGRQSVAST